MFKVRQVSALLATAAVLFLAGLWAARMALPEWQASRFGTEKFYHQRYAALSRHLGFEPSREPASVKQLGWYMDVPLVFEHMGPAATSWLVERNRALLVEVAGKVEAPKAPGTLVLDLSTDGLLWYARWDSGTVVPGRPGAPSDYSSLVQCLRVPGEELVLLDRDVFFGTSFSSYTVQGSWPPQFIHAESTGTQVMGFRAVGADQNLTHPGKRLRATMTDAVPELTVLLLGMALTGYFLFRRKLAWLVALLLSSSCMLLTMASMPRVAATFAYLLAVLVATGFHAVAVLFLWMAAESWLRVSSSDSVRGLDALIQGRLTHRVGTELLGGLVLGFALAGLKLLFSALAASVTGLHPLSASVVLQNPNFSDSFMRGAFFAVALPALSLAFFRSVRWTPVAACFAAALMFSPFAAWGPWYYGFLCSLALSAVMLAALQAIGLLGSLTASLVAFSSTLSAFLLLHQAQRPITLIAGIVFLGVILGLGVKALRWPRVERAPVKIFLSYAREEKRLRERLELFLATAVRKGEIEIWHDGLIEPGEDFDEAIRHHLSTSRIVVLLVSPLFLDSDYCRTETELAMAGYRVGATRVVPVLLAPCDWQEESFATLQILPDRPPVNSWSNEDEAFLNVATGIRDTARAIRAAD